jgi:hypothetical protein
VRDRGVAGATATRKAAPLGERRRELRCRSGRYGVKRRTASELLSPFQEHKSTHGPTPAALARLTSSAAEAPRQPGNQVVRKVATKISRAHGHAGAGPGRTRGRPTWAGGGMKSRALTLAVTGLVMAACARATPMSADELAFRAAVAVRGDDLDRALFCGADPARVLQAAREGPTPTSVPPAFSRSYRELLVARIEVTQNLRGSNGDNPDCIALRSRPDLVRLWPAPSPPTTSQRRSLPPPPLTNPAS